jgi:hypothetical protein
MSCGDPPIEILGQTFVNGTANIPLQYYQSVPAAVEPIYIIAPKNWGAEMVMKYEEAMRIHMNRNDVYVFPYGTELSCMKKSDNAVAIVKCLHCGQWSARYTCCKSCGAPVE